jgi:ketosteroid isomerase-like protein
MSGDLRARVRGAMADFSAGNPATFMALLHPEVTYRVIGTTSLSGTRRGLDAVMAGIMVPLSAALATPIEVTAERIIVDGDCVSVQATGHATFQSGAPYNNTYCFVFRFDGERIVEVNEYLDTALLGRALAVPVERTALLRAMDLNMWEMYRDIVRTGADGEILDTPMLTMARSPHGSFFHNMTMIREAVEPDAVLAAVRDFYLSRGWPFSIWTRAHTDEALEAALAARGFTQALSMPAMALLGDPGTICEPAGLEIRPTVDDAGRRDYLEITAEAYAVYGQERKTAEAAFAALESVCAPHLQGFVGYAGGKPVAAAAVYLTHGVAGIGWVGCVTEARGKRYAEAVTWAAIREGFRRGGAFANLQASPMGRAVYERMGFITPSHVQVWVGAA